MFPCPTSISIADLVKQFPSQDNIEHPALKRKIDTDDLSAVCRSSKQAKLDNGDCTGIENLTNSCDTNNEIAKQDKDANGTVLESKSLTDNGAMLESHSLPENVDPKADKKGCSVERVVFIDSTWNQTKSICNDERLKGRNYRLLPVLFLNHYSFMGDFLIFNFQNVHALPRALIHIVSTIFSLILY